MMSLSNVTPVLPGFEPCQFLGGVLSALPSLQLFSMMIPADRQDFFLLSMTGFMMDDLKNFCCQNPNCSDYGRRNLPNLRVCFRYGPDKQRRMLTCRTCQKRFSERKGTPLFNCQLPDEKAFSVFQHLQESCGVRQTARLVGVNRNTVIRLALLAGQHANNSHADLVAFSPSNP